MIVILCALLACGGGEEEPMTEAAQTAVAPVEAKPDEPKWYKGGTLHRAGALEWQEATRANKLATCADFIAKMVDSKSLKPELAAKVSSVDDVKPLAKQLVKQLDDAMEKTSDVDLNRRMYTNQTVPDMVVLTIVAMGWTN